MYMYYAACANIRDGIVASVTALAGRAERWNSVRRQRDAEYRRDCILRELSPQARRDIGAADFCDQHGSTSLGSNSPHIVAIEAIRRGF
jgi:hypothetical protein